MEVLSTVGGTWEAPDPFQWACVPRVPVRGVGQGEMRAHAPAGQDSVNGESPQPRALCGLLGCSWNVLGVQQGRCARMPPESADDRNRCRVCRCNCAVCKLTVLSSPTPSPEFWKACRGCLPAQSEPGPSPSASLLPGIAWCLIPWPASWELGNTAAVLRAGQSNKTSCFPRPPPGAPLPFPRLLGSPGLWHEQPRQCRQRARARSAEPFPKQRAQAARAGRSPRQRLH